MMKPLMQKIAVILTPLLLLVLIIFSIAATPAIPAATDLPPRPTVEPTATPTEPLPVTPDNVGAAILLYVPGGSSAMWTIVQWQDAFGNWHDIDGWRGHLDDAQGQMKIWWVAPKDFGTGPFRWQVYSHTGGSLLGGSKAFYLPAKVDELVYVEIDLMP